MNDRSVAMIIKKLIDSEKKIPEVKYVMCPRQTNSYDCGPYTIMYTEKIAENIEEGVEITKLRDFDAKDYRMKLRRKIEKKFNLNLEKLTEDEKSIPNRDGKKLNDRNKEERKKECWHYTNRTCRFAKNCRDEHKQHCKEMIENGYCYDQACKLGHPRICRDIFGKGICKRYVCRYFHPINLRNKNFKNQPIRKHVHQEMHEGGSQNRRNVQQDHTYGTHWRYTDQQHFLGNQHEPVDMGWIVTDLVSAVKRMNTSIERLERRDIKRWTQ